MDERTLTALQGSIKKWEEIVSGAVIDKGTENCPLCREFVNKEDPDKDNGEGCYGCPVAAEMEESGCGGTPYDKWSSYMGENLKYVGSPDRMVFDDRSKQLAQAELDFLKSLLPSQSAALHEDQGEPK